MDRVPDDAVGNPLLDSGRPSGIRFYIPSQLRGRDKLDIVREHERGHRSYALCWPVSNLAWAIVLALYTIAIAAQARISIPECTCDGFYGSPRLEKLQYDSHDSVIWDVLQDSQTGNPTVSAVQQKPVTTESPRSNTYQSGDKVSHGMHQQAEEGAPHKFYGLSHKEWEHSPDRVAFAKFFRDDVVQGLFVEVGAGDGRSNSNTLFFEESLGWGGLVIEGEPSNFEKLSRTYRAENRTTKVQAAICDKPGLVSFVGCGDSAGIKKYMSHAHFKKYLESWGDTGDKATEVECMTLQHVLEENSISKVDVLFVDVEGGELSVMKSIDFRKVHIRSVVVDLPIADGRFESKVREILLLNDFCLAARVGVNEFWVADPVMRQLHCGWKSFQHDP